MPDAATYLLWEHLLYSESFRKEWERRWIDLGGIAAGLEHLFLLELRFPFSKLHNLLWKRHHLLVLCHAGAAEPSVDALSFGVVGATRLQ